MSESQNHGFKVEDIAIKQLTGCEGQKGLKEFLKSNSSNWSYTSKDDIPHNIKFPNGKIYSNPIQVKAQAMKKDGSFEIELGDYIRNDDFINNGGIKTLLVFPHQQINKKTKRIESVYEYKFKKHKDIFNVEIKEFDSYVKSIPAGKAAQLKNQSVWKEKRNILLENNPQINKINAKIDSKDQRRVQTSIGSKDANEMFEYQTFKKDWKGLTLPITIESAPRQRNGKK